MDNVLQMGAKHRVGGMHANPPTDVEGFMPYRCELCQCPFFDHVYTFMKRSAIISPIGKDELKHVNVFRCENCGWILGSPISEDARKQFEEAVERMKSAQPSANEEPAVEIEEEKPVNLSQ